MSFEEFLEWADEDAFAEWVDGAVVPMSPASNRHQDLATFLATLVRVFSDYHGLGEVRAAPFLMKLARSGREPDLVFVARERQDRIRKAYLDGPADLVVEIVSPDSRIRDRREKLGEYQEAGVREYWIVDPTRKRADFNRLVGDRYVLVPVNEGLFRSEVLAGFWLRVEWLWQHPLPSSFAILREWKLV
jgi:Uma2 family endonuclease